MSRYILKLVAAQRQGRQLRVTACRRKQQHHPHEEGFLTTAKFLHSLSRKEPTSPSCQPRQNVCDSTISQTNATIIISNKTTKSSGSTTSKSTQDKAKKRIDRKKNLNPRYGASPKAVDLVEKISSVPLKTEDTFKELDKWVASQTTFTIAYVKQALQVLEHEKQWDRIVQVSKWMLSKGQGKTLGTYEVLLHALDMLRKDDEAEAVWKKEILESPSSVPTRVFSYALAMYERQNKPKEVIKLFISMEQSGRRNLDSESVRRVARAFEKAGFVEKRKQVLRQYNLTSEVSGGTG